MKAWRGWWRPRRRRSESDPRDEGARRAKVLFWAEILGAAAAVVVVLFPVVRFLGAHADDVFGDGDSGWIEVSEANVANGPQFSTRIGDRFVQTAESTPAIDLTVRNTGEDPVLLTEARVTIEDSARLPNCILGGGGEVPVSPPYTVFLPILPRPEERIRHRRLHEEVPAQGLDRFVLQFGLPPDGENDHLYAMHLELLADRPQQTIDAGRFLLGVPDSPSRGGGILPEDNRTLALLRSPYQRRYRLTSVWCMRRNLAELHRLLRTPGKRSPEVRALARLQLASEWPSYKVKRTPRESVAPLLRAVNSEGPVLAVFAAKQTGDQRLLEATAKRAAALEVEQARKEIGYEYLSGAAVPLRQALALAPSPSAQSLWERVEARVRAEEKEDEGPS